MARIEAIKCLLNSIDDVNNILEVVPDDNVIHVQATYPETRTPNIRRYPYIKKLEWEDPDFLGHIGKQVEIRLSDGVVDKILPLA